MFPSDPRSCSCHRVYQRLRSRRRRRRRCRRCSRRRHPSPCSNSCNILSQAECLDTGLNVLAPGQVL